MGRQPRDNDEKDWPFEAYYRAQLRSMEARQKWLWKDGYFPEIGWFWELIKLLLRTLTYPLRLGLHSFRRQKRLKEFRAFIRGDEKS
ncbi:MAG: hypothetical protein L0177_07370 [Chloroflexi bacterium]|nr:hypothetical protein [Chloroflexota bacterium]